VRVQLVGICNTDVELLRGYYNFRGVPGHEFVGTVEEVRVVVSAAKKKWLGQQVCGEINISCRALGRRPMCDFCRRGLKRHCARGQCWESSAHPGLTPSISPLPAGQSARRAGWPQ